MEDEPRKSLWQRLTGGLKRPTSALGGADNVIEVEGCITRLRCELEDMSLIDEPALKKAGAMGVVRMGAGVQVIVGPEADTIASDIQDLM